MFSVFDRKPRIPPVSVPGRRRVGVKRSELYRRSHGAFRRRVKPPVIRWMQDNVRFPSNWESTRFDLKRGPHVRGVIERFWLNPKMRKANLPWAVRSMKTTTLLAIISYCAENDPNPMAILFPDQKVLEAGLWEHIYPMFEQMAVIRRQLLPKRQRNRKAIVFRDCRVRLANAGTVSDSSGYPALYIFKFEHDKCPTSKSHEADSSRRIESRCAGYARGAKILEEGSPGDLSTSRAARLLANQNIVQFRYVVPCPHCGHHQKLEFRQLKIPKTADKKWNAALASRGSYYECSCCEGRIEDHHRAAMMQRGQWIGQGEWVDVNGNRQGELECDSDTCVFGEYSILYSLLIKGWGEIGREWVECLEAEKAGDVEARRRFDTEFLAKPWNDAPPTTENNELALHLCGSHERYRLPEKTAFLTTTADVGLAGSDLVFYWQVMAWMQGCQGAVIDWGITIGVPSFQQFVREKRYQFQEREKLWLPIADFPIAVDSGRYTTEVYNVVDMIPGAVAIKGDSTSRQTMTSLDLYRGGFRKQDQSEAVLKMKKKLGLHDLTFINSHATQRYRESLVACRIQRGWRGFVELPANVAGEGYWQGFEGYFEQLKADYFDRGKWERNGANEAGDNLRYGRAIAEKHTRGGRMWDTIVLPKRYEEELLKEEKQKRVSMRRRTQRMFPKNFISKKDN